MIDLQAAKRQTDILDMVSRYVAVRRNGSTYEALCPFHQEKTPSFRIFMPQQDEPHAHCFGCGWHGDVLDFVQKIEGISLPKAVELVAGSEWKARPKVAPLPELTGNLRKAPHKLPQDLAYRYHEAMRQEHWDYWGRRGFSEQTIRLNHLGWDDYRRRYTIPVFVNSRLIGFKFRAGQDDQQDKYITTHGMGAVLFNCDELEWATSQDIIVICEGELDALRLSQEEGLVAVSSTAGSKTWKKHWAGWFPRGRAIYICYDNDEAGWLGAAQVAGNFPGRSWLVRLPDAIGEKAIKDVGDFFDSSWPNAAKGFQELIARASQIRPQYTNYWSSSLASKGSLA